MAQIFPHGEFNPQLEVLRECDFENLAILRTAKASIVQKVRHGPSNLIMARKTTFLETKTCTREQILEELEILSKFNSPFIVKYYGWFFINAGISIFMEFMYCGSLEIIVNRHGAIEDEGILCKITYAILNGLIYLKNEFKMLHQNLKPSNILLNTTGEIKLCDFSASRELINSLTNSYVCYKSYVSPEQLQGLKNLSQSDIWSLGITILEIAKGRFPIHPEPIPKKQEKKVDGFLILNDEDDDDEPEEMSIFNLLDSIVNDPSPKLESTKFSIQIKDFIDRCVRKNPDERDTLEHLLKHEWIEFWIKTNDDANISAWASLIMDFKVPLVAEFKHFDSNKSLTDI